MPRDDKTELFWLVNKNDNELGSIARADAHSDKTKIHRAVYVLVFHGGNLLFQKRSKHKDKLPLHWTLSATGHVNYGENWETAAKRELFEEVGIKAQKVMFITKSVIYGKEETEMGAVFKTQVDSADFKLDKTEVEQAKWVALKELNSFISTHQLTPSALKVLKLAGFISK